MGKLESLEARAAELRDQNAVVTVAFNDGTEKRVKLIDAILYFQFPPIVKSIEGEVGPGNGRLLEIMRDLLIEGEPPI